MVVFITKFPAIAIFISYEKFVEMTEDALIEFKELIANNKQIKKIYSWDEEINLPCEECGIVEPEKEDKKDE